MRIRTIAIGFSLSIDDFASVEKISMKIKHHANILHDVERVLKEHGYEVMNKQITLNSFEHWLPCQDIHPGNDCQYDISQMNDAIDMLVEELHINDIKCCSIGGISSSNALEIVPHIIRRSTCIHIGCSLDCADNDLTQVAAETLLELAQDTPDDNEPSTLTGGRFALAFNCPANAPHPSISYHPQGAPTCLTVALECGDLLFLAFHGVTDFTIAAENLTSAYRQMLTPINAILEDICCASGIGYGGIDPSMTPGSELYDSVALGLEQLPPYRFGARGSMQIAATVNQALQQLMTSSPYLKLCGLNGLILSPLTDIVLARRCVESADVAAGVHFPTIDPPRRPALSPPQPPPVTFTLRDVIGLVGVCGGGLDWAPVCGDEFTAESLSAVLMDLKGLTRSSKKPLFCR